jgi:hypothetical protein
MRAATRERMISILALVLVISIGFRVLMAVAQSDKYSKSASPSQTEPLTDTREDVSSKQRRASSLPQRVYSNEK